MDFKFGLIGVGRWGKAYLNTFSNRSDVRLAAVCSSNPETRALIPSNCLLFNSWQEMLNLAKIDAVIIATPPQFHTSILKAAIAQDLPAIVEKPLSLYLSEVDELEVLLKKKSLPVLVNHVHLFSPAFVELKKQLLARPHPILEIESEGGAWGPFRPDYSALWDYAPHDLSMCLSLTEEFPHEIKAQILENREGTLGEEKGQSFKITLGFPSGTACTIRVGNIFKEKVRMLKVKTAQQKFEIDDLKTDKLWELSGNPIPISVQNDLPLNAMLSAFCKMLMGKLDPRASLRLAREVTQILTICDDAAKD